MFDNEAKNILMDGKLEDGQIIKEQTFAVLKILETGFIYLVLLIHVQFKNNFFTPPAPLNNQVSIHFK